MGDYNKNFEIRRKGLRRAQPILTALATVGNQGNPLLAVRLHLPANLTNFRFIFGPFKSHTILV